MTHHPRATRLPILALVVAAALVACDTTRPTASPTAGSTSSPRPAAEVYAEIRAAAETIRGLAPTAAVEPVLIDPDQLGANLEAEFDAENTLEELRDAEDALIALGLLPPGSSLRALTLDFQTAQVAGYYSPDKDQLFVVDRGGGLDASDRVTYAHEFVHQLQDQRFDLGALFAGAAEEGDRALARLALIEGDAVSVQTSWTTANLTSQEVGELLAAALNPEAMDALRRAPAYLRETVLFHYQDGAAFVNRLLAGGGYAAIDAAFDDPPESTEQVLHPDTYLEREPPLAVTLPDGIPAALGAGWSEAERDTLGELVLRIWLREGDTTAALARTAAAGWGGDRTILLRGPNDAVAVGIASAWDTPADAQEFATAAEAALVGLERAGQVVHQPGSAIVVIALGERSAALAGALEGAAVGG